MFRLVRVIGVGNLYDENGPLTLTQLLEHCCDRVPRVLGRRSPAIPRCVCLGNRRHGRYIGL
jgi:hypothetical protein